MKTGVGASPVPEQGGASRVFYIRYIQSTKFQPRYFRLSIFHSGVYYVHLRSSKFFCVFMEGLAGLQLVTGVGKAIIISGRHYGKYKIYITSYPYGILNVSTRIGDGNCPITQVTGPSTYVNYTSYTIVYPSDIVAICHRGVRWTVTRGRMGLVGNGRIVTRTTVHCNYSKCFNCPVAPRSRIVRALVRLGP